MIEQEIQDFYDNYINTYLPNYPMCTQTQLPEIKATIKLGEFEFEMLSTRDRIGFRFEDTRIPHYVTYYKPKRVPNIDREYVIPDYLGTTTMMSYESLNYENKPLTLVTIGETRVSELELVPKVTYIPGGWFGGAVYGSGKYKIDSEVKGGETTYDIHYVVDGLRKRLLKFYNDVKETYDLHTEEFSL